MSANGGRINWEDVKRRLDESQQALDRALTTSAESFDTVYRERAAQLALRGVQESASTTTLRVLVFALGMERYALEFADLVSMLPFANCTPVPGGPPQLLGVINVHGEIRSVVDLGRLLELPERTRTEGGYVLLLRKQGRQVGLRVDTIDKIQFVPVEELAVPGEGEASLALHFLKGLGADRLRLLNTDALFAHPLFRGTAT